jgi:hypothetical protein
MLGVIIGWPFATRAQDAVLTEWVDSNPFGDPAKIALGYPVPKPVDTPLPFGGFRTYAGLHARHQDLAATTEWVHPEIVGSTRQGRTIWAYRLGDFDQQTLFGLPEPATLTNGGIHAREWQTPETVTGILELMATHEGDDHLYDYLRENVNMIVVPTLNIDGFLQTQRYPVHNYLGIDDRYPATSPRDGRMRRKNMLNTDESLESRSDLLNGVDLNRNNEPFWNTDPERSSPSPQSLVHHGAQPASEPEIKALDAAAQLGPIEQLRLYTDVHSFSQVHFWVRNDNARLASQTQAVLSTFSNHHVAFDARKRYVFSELRDTAKNRGIGTTDEYFTHTYQVPSWTLEIEPSGGQSFHRPLPGCGADYGGDANNCHDGFILPESEIRRVREELAQTFAAVYYRQAGPPSVQAMRVIDELTGAVVYQAEWDVADDDNRVLFEHALQAVQTGRPYRLWLAFNKPMRWRAEGEPAPFQGQAAESLDIDLTMLAGSQALAVETLATGWLDQDFEAPDGYLHYRDDAYYLDFVVSENAENAAALENIETVTLQVTTGDLVNMQLDANPATIAHWADGAWLNHESSDGGQGDTGGTDSSLGFPITRDLLADPFVLEPGISGAWFDPDHDGEGFIFEILASGIVVVYWFTYDDQGHQDWYLAVGEARGNRVVFPELLRVSGGVFGDAFDPAQVTEEVVGTARFTFSDCGEGVMDWRIGNRTGRQSLSRLTHIMGLDCGLPILAPVRPESLFSGSWFDPAHDGEGFVVEILRNNQVVVYWFSFGPDGARRWYFGIGEIVDGTLVVEKMLTTAGGVFGDDFDPAEVELLPWGNLRLSLDCDGGTAEYASTEAGFGAGQQHLIKLTQLDGLECSR